MARILDWVKSNQAFCIGVLVGAIVVGVIAWLVR